VTRATNHTPAITAGTVEYRNSRYLGYSNDWHPCVRSRALVGIAFPLALTSWLPKADSPRTRSEMPGTAEWRPFCHGDRGRGEHGSALPPPGFVCPGDLERVDATASASTEQRWQPGQRTSPPTPATPEPNLRHRSAGDLAGALHQLGYPRSLAWNGFRGFSRLRRSFAPITRFARV
jgi:hypothetical protein